MEIGETLVSWYVEKWQLKMQDADDLRAQMKNRGQKQSRKRKKMFQKRGSIDNLPLERPRLTRTEGNRKVKNNEEKQKCT